MIEPERRTNPLHITENDVPIAPDGNTLAGEDK